MNLRQMIHSDENQKYKNKNCLQSFDEFHFSIPSCRLANEFMLPTQREAEKTLTDKQSPSALGDLVKSFNCRAADNK
jgi:hypothetical protein